MDAWRLTLDNHDETNLRIDTSCIFVFLMNTRTDHRDRGKETASYRSLYVLRNWYALFESKSEVLFNASELLSHRSRQQL
mmetsp:Transcript_19267/g.53703  ORF Transcript_19267/g.53703 Transcript_19267/m.53703 type:complete len:80 (-) Transcript_19267:8719-8958(-)